VLELVVRATEVGVGIGVVVEVERRRDHPPVKLGEENAGVAGELVQERDEVLRREVVAVQRALAVHRQLVDPVQLADIALAGGREHPHALSAGAVDVLAAGAGERLAPQHVGVLGDVDVDDLPVVFDPVGIEQLGPRLPRMQVVELGDDAGARAPAAQRLGERVAVGGRRRGGRERARVLGCGGVEQRAVGLLA
jgi:hypothetical protein